MPTTSKNRSATRFWPLVALLAGLLPCLLSPSPAAAQSAQLMPFGGQTYASPFYVAGDPGDPSRVFVVEAAGRIRLVENGVTQSAAFLDVNTDVWDRSAAEGNGCECGMFSMAFAPDYATSGLFYVYFTRDVPGAPGVAPFHDLVIREFRRSTTDPDDADESTGRDVMVIQHRTASNHNGGQLQFGPDGYLYIATGDGGGANDPGNNAQNLDSLLGKMLRIDPGGVVPFPTVGAYSIPVDNPFAGATAGADEIYAYGLRNPYRFSFDRLTGDLTIGDVGQGALEEVDFTESGAGIGVNFGWDCFEGTALGASSSEAQCTPLPANHTPPVLEYANPPMGGAAVTGGYVVRDLTVPSLLGRYVYTDSSGALGTNIYSAVLSEGGSTGNGPTGLNAGGVVSFGEDACGHVYVVAIGGTVSRIEPTGGSPACMPQVPAASGSTATDKDPPDLSVKGRKSRRAAAKGEVRLVVSCDEACTVVAQGEIRKPGSDIGLDPDSASVGAGGKALLRLDLSRAESRRLARLLRRGRRAKAIVELIAADTAGNSTLASRTIKQKR